MNSLDPRLLRLRVHPELLRLGRAAQGRVRGRVGQALGAQQRRAQELRGHPEKRRLFCRRDLGNDMELPYF